MRSDAGWTTSQDNLVSDNRSVVQTQSTFWRLNAANPDDSQVDFPDAISLFSLLYHSLRSAMSRTKHFRSWFWAASKSTDCTAGNPRNQRLQYWNEMEGYRGDLKIKSQSADAALSAFIGECKYVQIFWERASRSQISSHMHPDHNTIENRLKNDLINRSRWEND